jgi:hypothetical protein
VCLDVEAPQDDAFSSPVVTRASDEERNPHPSSLRSSERILATAAQQEALLGVTKSPVDRPTPRPMISDEDRALLDSGNPDDGWLGGKGNIVTDFRCLAELRAFGAAYGVSHTLKSIDGAKRHRNKARMDGLKQQLTSMSKQLSQLKSVASGMEKDFVTSNEVGSCVRGFCEVVPMISYSCCLWQLVAELELEAKKQRRLAARSDHRSKH